MKSSSARPSVVIRRIDCRFQDETLWLSQAMIAELFQKDVRTTNEHLQNIYEEAELDPRQLSGNSG